MREPNDLSKKKAVEAQRKTETKTPEAEGRRIPDPLEDGSGFEEHLVLPLADGEEVVPPPPYHNPEGKDDWVV